MRISSVRTLIAQMQLISRKALKVMHLVLAAIARRAMSKHCRRQVLRELRGHELAQVD